jgi:hypothetical protein
MAFHADPRFSKKKVLGTDSVTGIAQDLIDATNLEDLANVEDTAADDDILVYNSGTGLWESVNLSDSVTGAIGAITYEMTGFPHSTAGVNTQTTLTWNDATRTVTLTPTGAYFDFWSQGVRFRKTVAQSLAIPNVDGEHFVYFNSSGNIVTAQTPWDLLQDVPVCFIYWNSSLAKGIPYEERHGVVMDGSTHSYLHFTRGTQYISGMAISAYTVAPSSPANANNTFAIASGIVADEDLRSTLTAVSSGSYSVFTRSGASGLWTWTTGNTVPFPLSGSDFAINVFSGGTWTTSPLTSNNYANIYVFAIPSITANLQFAMIPGQALYATLADAQNENINSLSLGTLPFQENVLIYQITFQRGNSYTTTGKVRIAAAPVTIRGSATVNVSGINSHNNLAGLQGGAAGEYYHLTTAQIADVTTILAAGGSTKNVIATDSTIAEDTSYVVIEYLDVSTGAIFDIIGNVEVI